MTRKPTMQAIVGAVASTFNMKHELLSGPSRKRIVTRPRHIAMFLTREITTFSYPKIGRYFHRDHTTVYAGVQVIANLIMKKPTVAANVERARVTLRLRGYDI